MYLGHHIYHILCICLLLKWMLFLPHMRMSVAMSRKFLTGQDIHWRLLLVSGNMEVRLPIMMVLRQGLDKRFHLCCHI